LQLRPQVVKHQRDINKFKYKDGEEGTNNWFVITINTTNRKEGMDGQISYDTSKRVGGRGEIEKPILKTKAISEQRREGQIYI
jgi:hypothetical protein